MKRIVEFVCLWLIALGMLILLSAPTSSIAWIAGTMVMASVVLTCIGVVKLIWALRPTPPNYTYKSPRWDQAEDRMHRIGCIGRTDDDDCADDLVDATAADLIDWDG